MTIQTLAAWVGLYLLVAFIVACFLGRFIAGCHRENERGER